MDSVAGDVSAVSVEVTTSGRSVFPENAGRFDHSASTQLLVFVYLTGSAALVETRRLGVFRRMPATPTTAMSIVLGERLGRVAVALVQGIAIVAGTSLLFGVRSGDPLVAGAMLLVFAVVAGGAGMVLVSVFGTEQQVGGAALMLGIGFAALGGSMVLLELSGEHRAAQGARHAARVGEQRVRRAGPARRSGGRAARDRLADRLRGRAVRTGLVVPASRLVPARSGCVPFAAPSEVSQRTDEVHRDHHRPPALAAVDGLSRPTGEICPRHPGEHDLHRAQRQDAAPLGGGHLQPSPVPLHTGQRPPVARVATESLCPGWRT